MRNRLRTLALAMSLGLAVTGCQIVGIPTPAPDRTGLDRAPWVLYGADAGELHLGVMMKGRDCDAFSGLDVIETATSVELKAWVDHDDEAACAAARAYESVTITLRVPLAGRSLLGCLIAASAPHDAREDCAEVVESGS